jgi:hypothetical protein
MRHSNLAQYIFFYFLNQFKIIKFLKNEDNHNKLRELIKYFDQKYGVIFFIDILLNHTSNDSKWLLKNPDSFYGPHNTPILKPALLLDLKLKEFSDLIAEGKIEEYPKGIFFYFFFTTLKLKTKNNINFPLI